MGKIAVKVVWGYFLFGSCLALLSALFPDSVSGPAYLFAAVQIVPVMVFAHRINKIPHGLVAAVSLIGASSIGASAPIVRVRRGRDIGTGH